MMTREELAVQVRSAEEQLHEVLAEADALATKKRISLRFRDALGTAMQAYQEAATGALQTMEKRLLQVEKGASDYFHGRGHSMPAIGPTKAFRQVYVAYPDPKPNGRNGEWLWARKIGRNTAILDNIPFFAPDLALRDFVRVNKDGKVTKVLEHGARTRHLKYAEPTKHTEAQLQKRYFALQEKLEPYDIVTEIMGPGLCCLSVPEDLDDHQLAVLAEQAGAQMLSVELGKQGPMGLFDSLPG